MKFKAKRLQVVYRDWDYLSHGKWFVRDTTGQTFGGTYVHSDGSIHNSVAIVVNGSTEWNGWFKSRNAARKAKALAEAKHGVY